MKADLLCRGLIALSVATITLPFGAPPAQAGHRVPIAGQATAYELSARVDRLTPKRKPRRAVIIQPRINPLAGEPGQGRRGTWTRAARLFDPLVRRSQNRAGRAPRLDLRFDGSKNPAACGGCSPPDTNGDVGPNHYIQLVNATKVAIYDKAGNLLTAPFDLGDLWSRGRCRRNDGDPIVLYDETADRWLLSQFAFDKYLCFAISQTSDPLGAYHLYTFNVGSFPDYFKVGVMRKGYFVGANERTYTAYAFDRRKMLRGNRNASFVKFAGETNFLMPADVDGSTNPPSNGLFYTFKDDSFHGGSDRIELFELAPDFATPANSTFQRIATIPIAPFTYTVCGFFNFNCIRQKSTTRRLDTVSEWPMQRLVYRRVRTHQALIGNFTVGGGLGEQGAAIRWFELRKSSIGAWVLYQEGTHDPGDGNDRFMGSIAMDKAGNIALGYSVSSSGMYPSVKYVTRRASDPLGTMRTERTLKNGRGAQTASNRWGDYSAMTVDPTTGCQFWYTNEFYSANSFSNWKTVVGAFTDPTCQ